MKQVLIILRGPPASGKSTIGAILRDSDKFVWLKTDNFKSFFLNTGEFTNIISKTALNSLNFLLDSGYSVIYEGIFQNPIFAEEAMKLAQNKNIPIFLYELTCSLKTLQYRDLTRVGVKEGCRKPLGDDVIKQIYYTIENSSIKNAIKLNTEKLSVEDCIIIIRKNFTP